MNKKLAQLLTVFIVCLLIVLTVALHLPTILFNSIVSGVSTPEELSGTLPRLTYWLDETAMAQYESLQDTQIDQSLYTALQSSDGPNGFATEFMQLVGEAYWQGYELHISAQTILGGRSGTLRVDGENIPQNAYAILTTNEETLVVDVMAGTGYYNLYGKEVEFITYYLAADPSGKTPLTAKQTLTCESLHVPKVMITELSNEHTITYFSDIENGNKQHSGKKEQKFQYIELYNYSDKVVDLGEYTFVYSDQIGEHSFEWILQEDGSLILPPGEVFVIGVYAADSALSGYRYDSSEEIGRYWEAFNEFYSVDIPETKRAMIACVASGKADVKLDGIDHLERSADAGVTVSARLVKNGQTECQVSLPDEMPYHSYAYQFLPGESAEADFLFVTGCFPGEILTEQDLSYCETTAPRTTNKLTAVSYNILATDDNPADATVKERSRLFFRFMEEYQPDTIGLQEVNYRWTPRLSEEMKLLGYAEVQGISGNGHTYENISTFNEWDLMNPIYYKADKYELLESGHCFLTTDGTIGGNQWDSVNMKRTMTWAVLKDTKTDDVITHINTHLVLSGKEARVEQVRMMYNKADQLQQKYGGSIIITGDHNMTEGSEPYQAYVNSGIVVDAKYQTTDHDSISTYTNFDTKYSNTYCAPIDFCFISPDLTVDKYKVFDGKYSDGVISDHNAVIVELYR